MMHFSSGAGLNKYCVNRVSAALSVEGGTCSAPEKEELMKFEFRSYNIAHFAA